MRQISSLVKRSICLAAVAISVAGISGAAAAAGGGGDYHAESMIVDVDNRSSVLRGAVLFSENCMGCHSLSMQRYSRLAQDFNLDPEKMRGTIILDPEVKFGDHIVSPMAPADAKAWLGATPPDLTLFARARSPEYIYNFLRSFYVDQGSSTGFNNAMLPGTAMPNVLAKFQTGSIPVYDADHKLVGVEMVKLEGMSESDYKAVVDRYDRVTKDLTNYLAYVSEPGKSTRQSVGMWVLLYLMLFAVVMYMLKQSYWKHIH